MDEATHSASGLELAVIAAQARSLLARLRDFAAPDCSCAEGLELERALGVVNRYLNAHIERNEGQF